MRLLFLCSLFCASLWAQAPTISGVGVANISYSSATIQWTSSISTGIARVQYDSLTSTLPFANSTQLKNSSSATSSQAYTIGGLAPNTLYYFVACSTNSGTSQEGCSTVNSFTTSAAPAGWPTIIPTPTLPTVSPLPAMPTSYSNTYMVNGATDCSDGTNGLQALINAAAAVGGSGNKLIQIPATDNCVATGYVGYALPVNTGSGWIVIRTAAPDSSLPPEGVRIDSTYAMVMPSVASPPAANYSNPLAAAFYINTTTSNWRFVGLRFIALANALGGREFFWGAYGQYTGLIFDRNIFFANGGNGDIVGPAGIIADGINTWICNNQLTVIVPSSNGYGVEMTGAEQMVVDNNNIGAIGISVYAQENALQGANVPQGYNYQISRNSFSWNPAYINTTAGARQFVEFKAGNLILINGNTFTSQWTENGTGPYSQSIELTPRNGTGSLALVNNLADITITNNTWSGVTGGIQLWGAENNLVVFADTAATKRVLIQNNLLHDINGWYGQGSFTANGHFFSLAYALEGVTINHNTLLGNRGVEPMLFAWNGGPGASIRITNNFLTSTYDSASSAGNLIWQQDTSGQLPAPSGSSLTAASQWWGGTTSVVTNNPNIDPSSRFTNNVILPQINSAYSTNTLTNYALVAAAYTPANCNTFWSSVSGNVCAGNAGTTTANSILTAVSGTPLLGLWGPVTNTTGYPAVANWRLVCPSGTIGSGLCSSYISGARYTTDGLDVGANIDTLEAAQGVVSNAHAYSSTSTSTNIGFLAPDANGCVIDYDTTGVFTPGAFTRVSNSGGARVQNVSITGLPAHGLYYFRVDCQVYQPQISVQLP